MLLKTSEAAKELGVSQSTVKRWVDLGMIDARKTAGGHRLIPLSEARRLASEQRLGNDGIGFEGEAGEVGSIEALAEDLAVGLRRGRLNESKRIMERAYAHYRSASVLGDMIVGPALGSVGREWQHGHLDVYQEHRATRAVEQSVGRLIESASRESRQSRGLLAIGASPEGDPYSIPGLLCELALVETGWNVMNLGPNLPLGSFAKAIAAHRPRLAWLSASHVADVPAFARGVREVWAVAGRTDCELLIGGQALSAEVVGLLGDIPRGSRLADLVGFSERISMRRASRGEELLGPDHEDSPIDGRI
jgi:excisionase family DNA binding protein